MIGSPVMLRKFDSGVKVIQNKSHSDEEVLSSLIFIKLTALDPVLTFLATERCSFFPSF